MTVNQLQQPLTRALPRDQLTLSVQTACASSHPQRDNLKHQLPRHAIQRYLCAALFLPAEITVRFVDAQEGKQLNREFRNKDYATNVLTFDYSHAPVVSADLVICLDVMAQEAQEQGISLQAHGAHLLVHSALHAQGYDHETESDAQLMESIESRIMQKLGFADPYRT